MRFWTAVVSLIGVLLLAPTVDYPVLIAQLLIAAGASLNVAVCILGDRQ